MKPEDFYRCIIYEDEYFLVLNKPAGIVVERDAHGYDSVQDSAEKYLLRKKAKTFVGIVHRLDRPVSGLLLIAKKKSVLKSLNEQFAKKEVTKIYLAKVEGKLPATEGKLNNWLIKDPKKKMSHVYDTKQPGSYECTLFYEVISGDEQFSFLEVSPATGKYHQIRAQLAHAGCPIVGDMKYGSTILVKENTIYLHAHKLLFHHPVSGKTMKFSISPPDLETETNPE